MKSSLMDLWNQNSYHDYDKATSVSWLWRRHHDVRHNCSDLVCMYVHYKHTYILYKYMHIVHLCIHTHTHTHTQHTYMQVHVHTYAQKHIHIYKSIAKMEGGSTMDFQLGYDSFGTSSSGMRGTRAVDFSSLYNSQYIT